MSTGNNKKYQFNKFIYQLSDTHNLKNPNNKNIGLVNIFAWWIIFYRGDSGLLWIYHKKHETLAENPLIQIYPNKIKNRIAFKIKTRYKLELLSSETMKLWGSIKKDVEKDRDGEDVPKLEPVEVCLVHCSLVNNSYQQASKALFSFVPNK